MNEVGDRLKQERERLGFNQTAFGAIGGVKTLAQHNYEKGTRRPDTDYLAAIAKVGADIQYIVTGDRSAAALPAEENMLLTRYRASPAPLRDAAMRVLLGGEVDSGGNAQVILGGVGHVQIGKATRIKK